MVFCHLLVFCFYGDGNWGCAKVYGRGTLYMKWGQGNQRFATMRLRGEKRKQRKDENINKMKIKY